MLFKIYFHVKLLQLFSQFLHLLFLFLRTQFKQLKSPCDIVWMFLLLQLLLKAQTSSMFKGKKENYPLSVCSPFVDTRIRKNILIVFFICETWWWQHYALWVCVVLGQQSQNQMQPIMFCFIICKKMKTLYSFLPFYNYTLLN